VSAKAKLVSSILYAVSLNTYLDKKSTAAKTAKPINNFLPNKVIAFVK
jgi:hypothetical protein